MKLLRQALLLPKALVKAEQQSLPSCSSLFSLLRNEGLISPIYTNEVTFLNSKIKTDLADSGHDSFGKKSRLTLVGFFLLSF